MFSVSFILSQLAKAVLNVKYKILRSLLRLAYSNNTDMVVPSYLSSTTLDIKPFSLTMHSSFTAQQLISEATHSLYSFTVLDLSASALSCLTLMYFLVTLIYLTKNKLILIQ